MGILQHRLQNIKLPMVAPSVLIADKRSDTLLVIEKGDVTCQLCFNKAQYIFRLKEPVRTALCRKCIATLTKQFLDYLKTTD